MPRRLMLALCALGLASAASIAFSAPVIAECPYVAIPPATEAASSAREIIVGTVVGNVGGQLYDFRLRIEHVLRGPAKVGDIRRVTFLYPKWPLVELADGSLLAPCEAIPGSPGNVIALAYSALAPDATTRYNAASWISGKPAYRDEVPTTTLAEMAALAGLPQTDAAPAIPGSRDQRLAATNLLAVLTLSLVAGSGTAFWLKKRASFDRR